MRYLILLIIVLASCSFNKSKESAIEFKNEVQSIVKPCGEKGTEFYKKFTPHMKVFIEQKLYPDSLTLNFLSSELKNYKSINDSAISNLGKINEYDTKIPVVETYINYYEESKKMLILDKELIKMLEKKLSYEKISKFISDVAYVQLKKQDESAKYSERIVEKFEEKYIKN